MIFDTLYINFLNQLEEISKEHDELTDTDVRVRLHEILNWYFIWDNSLEDFPKRYAMFSDEADNLVYEAILEFVQKAKIECKGIVVGQARNDLLEGLKLKTEQGNEYDWYLGSSSEVLPPEKPSLDSIYED